MDEAWERAVEAARGGEAFETVRTLTLDGAVKCSQGRLPAAALLEQFSQLRVLSIANVGLASLTDFPSLPHLERLVLSDNRISGGLEALVDAGLVSLRDLDLSNNKLQNLKDLAPLAKLNLLSLDLYECPVTNAADYRAKVFSAIKSLQYLDKVDAEDNERPESEDEEEEEEDDEDDEDDEDGLEVDDYEAAGLQKPQTTGNQFHTSLDDEDGDEESDEIDEEDEGARYNGTVNHVIRVGDDSGSEEDEDDEGDGDAVEVHDIEETEEDEGEGGDEDDPEGEEDDDEDDEDDDEEGTELALSLEGEIDAQEEGGDDENGELGDEDVVIENEGEDDDDDDVEYYGSGFSIRVEDEEGSDVELGDDEDDEGDDEPAPAEPSSKRKRSKDEDTDESDDERPPKH
ncbi:hypothetical protein L7F22_051839 [Adiantum nelumboides]|nr:hypothetical protein [Adiantum nelumboides]